MYCIGLRRRPSSWPLSRISSYTVRTTTLKLYHIVDICNIEALHYLEFSYHPWVKSYGAGKTGGVKNVHTFFWNRVYLLTIKVSLCDFILNNRSHRDLGGHHQLNFSRIFFVSNSCSYIFETEDS